MTRSPFILSLIACGTLFAFASAAQEPYDISGIPAPRGVYYHAASGWVSLTPTVLLPFDDGRPVALEVLNVGSDHTTAQLPGSRSAARIGNDSRPVFYLHDISPDDMHLMRATRKYDRREVRMHISRYFREWAHAQDKDVTDFDIVAVNGDVVVIRPSADLKPGEYVLAALMGPEYRWLKLGFDFSLVGAKDGSF
jgi:hypothetical protein